MMHQENKANKRQRLQHHQGVGVGSASGEGEGGLGRHPHAYATRGGGHGRFPQQTIGMDKGATSSTATRPSINLMNLVNVKGSSQSLLHHLLSEIGEDMSSQWTVKKSSQEAGFALVACIWTCLVRMVTTFNGPSATRRHWCNCVSESQWLCKIGLKRLGCDNLPPRASPGMCSSDLMSVLLETNWPCERNESASS